MTLAGAGRHEFVKAVYECKCGHRQAQSIVEFVRMGAWPGSPDSDQFQTVLDVRTLEDWERMTSFQPNSSVQGFLGMLSAQSRDYGGMVGGVLFRCCPQIACSSLHSHATLCGCVGAEH